MIPTQGNNSKWEKDILSLQIFAKRPSREHADAMTNLGLMYHRRQGRSAGRCESRKMVS